MILSLIKYFRGYVYVHLTGYAPERFLNLCGSHNILIWNLKPREDGYAFYISVSGYKSLKPLLKKTKTHARIVEKHGAPFALFRYRKRKLFLIGFVCFAAFLYYFSGFIWNIEVNGNSYLSEETIIRFLEEQEASFGTKIKKIDSAALEEELRSQYSEVIWTSIKIYGTKMTVDIQESLLPDEEYEVAQNEVNDIVAAKDGIITEMVTRNGTPLVASGAEVKKGDILVSGRLDILGDDGAVTEYLYHNADADITAKVIYRYQDEINISYQDKIKTGETKKNYEIQIFDKVFGNPFFKNPYKEYEIVSESRQLKLTHNFYLPVYLKVTEVSECENTQCKYTKEEAKELAKKRFLQYLTNLEEKGIQISEKNVMIEKVNQKYVIIGTVTAYESIVSYQPTEILEITSEERQQTDESD